MPLIDRFDGLLVDLDGVVWVGREPVPGSPEALAAMLAAGKQVVFVTNNPSRRPEEYAARLASYGIEVGPQQVVTAGIVAARLAAEVAPGGGALVLARETLRGMIEEAGLEVLDLEEARSAAVVVVSGWPGFDYEWLRGAKWALDAGATLIGTSHDPTMPMPGGEWPGTGAVLAAVETASGRKAEIAGKPERHLFELALAQMPGAERVAMVGDRLSSDIAGGHAAGLETVLVLSGTSGDDGSENPERAEVPPDHVVDDLAALLR